MPKAPHHGGQRGARRLASAGRSRPPASGQRPLTDTFCARQRPIPYLRNVCRHPASASESLATALAAPEAVPRG